MSSLCRPTTPSPDPISKANSFLSWKRKDPRSPHSEGALCPKGAAIFQLHANPNRATKVLHRAAGATEWEVWDLERAIDRVAELVAGLLASLGPVAASG